MGERDMRREKREMERVKIVLLSITLISNGVDYFSLFVLLVYRHIKLAIARMKRQFELSLNLNLIFSME